jgi:hypothetical protein
MNTSRIHPFFRRALWFAAWVFSLAIAFGYGFKTADSKAFPYWRVQRLAQWWNDSWQTGPAEPYSLSYRDHDTAGRSRVEPDTAASTGVYLVYGQSNASNSGQLGYEVHGDVLQAFEGSFYRYRDPALGGNGGNGSVWGMLGDRLIDSGQHRQVVFAVASIGGITLEQMLEGQLYNYLVHCHRQLMARFGRVDGLLFHQGEYNHRLHSGNNDYYRHFVELLEHLRRDGVSSPVYLSQTTRCGIRSSDTALLDIQDRLIRDHPGVRRGPNSDLLSDPVFRLPDKCHFSLEGNRRLAELWHRCLLRPSED